MLLKQEERMVNAFTFEKGEIHDGIKVSDAKRGSCIVIGSVKGRTKIFPLSASSPPEVRGGRIINCDVDARNPENPIIRKMTDPLGVLLKLSLAAKNPTSNEVGTWYPDSATLPRVLFTGLLSHPSGKVENQSQVILLFMISGAIIIVRPFGISVGDLERQYKIQCTRRNQEHTLIMKSVAEAKRLEHSLWNGPERRSAIR